MNRMPRLLLASALALALATALAAGASGAEPGIEIRVDDTVVLKSGDRLIGEITAQNDRELSIKLKEFKGAVRSVPMADVERILRRQNIKQAFEARLKECTAAKDSGALHGLAVEVLKLNPGMVDEAASALTAATGIRPDYGQAHLLLGQLYLRKGFVRKAAEEGQAAVKALPKEAAAHVLLATALVRGGEPRKAVAAIDAALELAPTPDDQVAAAATLAEAGEIQRAQDLLKALTESNPAAQLASGVASLRAADLTAATAMLDKAARALRGQGEPHLALAAALFLQGELDRATAELRELPSYGDARDAAPLALRGLIALRRGELDNADGLLKRAMVADPGRSRVAAARASLELARGNLPEAATALETPAADPACVDAYVHYLLGYVSHLRKDYPKAQTAYARAAELAPGWPDALLGAGSAALAGRSFQAAERHFAAAAKAAPELAAAHAGLGLACLGLAGRMDEADKELRRALVLDPRNISAHLGLGYLANRRGREAEALASFERAIGLDGANAFAADALNKLRSGRGEEVQYFGFDGPGLPAGWAAPDQRAGVTVTVADGRLLFSGKQRIAGGQGYETRFFMRLDSAKFARMEIDVEASPTGGIEAGIFVGGGGGMGGTGGDLELSMTQNGRLGWRKRDRSGWTTVEEAGDWPKAEGGAPAKLRLAVEMLDRGTFRLFAGGRPVSDKEIVVDTMAAASGLSVGTFCRAQMGDDVKVGFDNACLVTRKPKAADDK